MAGHEIHVSGLKQVVLNPRQNEGSVPVAQLGDDDSDGERSLRAQRTGEKVGAVIEITRGGKDAVLGFLRNGLCFLGVVKDERERSGGEAERLRQLLQADRPAL